MRILDIVVSRMRVRARDHDHAELAAARDEFAERIAIAEPRAAMMKRNLGRIIGDATAGAQADGVGLGALK